MRVLIARLVLLLMFCLVAISAGQAEEPAQRKPRVFEKVEGQIEKLFGNEEGLEDFRASTKVEAFRLKRWDPNSGDDNSDAEKPKIGPKVILSGPLELKPELAKEFLALLLDPASYRKRINECEPDPGIAIRYVHDESIWDVFLCLECDVVIVYRNDKLVASTEFQPAHDKFVGLMKELYPDDKAIQNIK